MAYDVIFYDKDFVYVEKESNRMISGFRGRPSGGNQMVVVSETNGEMHKRILVV